MCFIHCLAILFNYCQITLVWIRHRCTKQNVQADEAVFELDRQRSDAKAKQEREIATIQARETAETQKVQAEETKKADVARIKQEEEAALAAHTSTLSASELRPRTSANTMKQPPSSRCHGRPTTDSGWTGRAC